MQQEAKTKGRENERERKQKEKNKDKQTNTTKHNKYIEIPPAQTSRPFNKYARHAWVLKKKRTNTKYQQIPNTTKLGRSQGGSFSTNEDKQEEDKYQVPNTTKPDRSQGGCPLSTDESKTKRGRVPKLKQIAEPSRGSRLSSLRRGGRRQRALPRRPEAHLPSAEAQLAPLAVAAARRARVLP